MASMVACPVKEGVFVMEPLELNGVRLKMYDCKESAGKDGRMISFVLKVTSETYHDIAVLCTKNI